VIVKMPLLRKQPFERSKPPAGVKPEDEVFYCEATNEAFTDYEAFFDRTILCNSLVWSCAVTGKSNLTYEEAVESEDKAKKRISNLPKPLKKGLLWLTNKTKKGRVGEIVDDIYDWSKSRYFVGETVEAVIGSQWCESKITRVIAPTEQEINADADEITEVEQDGSPKKKEDGSEIAEKAKIANPPDHLYKYEVEETEPDDEDMVELHVIEADDIKREKGVLTRDKLSLYLKNVVELDGAVFKLKAKGIKLYNLDTVKFSDIFAGPEPEFEESTRKIGVMVNKKKGQFTLDGWATKGDKKPSQEKPEKDKQEKKKVKAEPVPKPKKQTPEELEAEMKKLREAQAKYREEMRIKAEEMKKKRIEDKQKEKERKAEEKRLVKEIMLEWNSRREDLDCEDHKELPKPTPVRCRIPNHLVGDFLALLEFLHSFSTILEVKDSYPSTGVTFAELESALVETEAPDGAYYDIVSFMLVTLFDLQLEEEEEAKADTDKTAHDELHEGHTGKNEEIANAIRAATMTHLYTKKNLGLTLREVHLDQWSITEVLRLHLESSGAYRGNNLHNWRYQQRGGWRLQDDPGFQFCLENPQILASLQEKSVFDLGVTEKLKLMTVMMNQMLSFAGVRDEVDTRMENVFETRQELKEAMAEENKRLRELKQEEINRVKEERQKLMEEKLKEAENKKNEKEKKLTEDENKDIANAPKKDEKKETPALTLTTRQQEAALVAKEKEDQEKVLEEEDRKSDWMDRETKLNTALAEYQRGVAVHCLGRDRAYRRFWVFDSVPGVFVEHEDDQIGECRETPTPWDPEAVVEPLNEEQAIKKAKEMMEVKGETVPASPSSDKENKSSVTMTNSGPSLAVGEVGKTYSKKTPVLKQKVLGTNNGSLSVQKEEEVKAEVETKTEEVVIEAKVTPEHPPWGRCLATGAECPVHSSILPRAHWAFYSTVEEIDGLVEGLNSRGIREGELKDKIVTERERIESRVRKCKVDQLVVSKDETETLEKNQLDQVQARRDKNNQASPLGTSLQEVVDLSLRDQILELEEKIWVGSLGNLKVKNRDKWLKAISAKKYEMGAESLTWGDGDKVETDGLLGRETRPGSPDTEGNKRESGASTSSNSEVRGEVRQMAAAILQVGQMIADREKFLKQPLGEDEKERKKRLKREEDEKKWKEQHPEEEEEEEDEEVEGRGIMTAFKRWEKSLMSSTNFGQLFIHLTTLDNSIIWSKSIMNTKCKVCRRKTDSDNMLLCDSCDNGHHIYCLKPKLKVIPSGDWFCPECKPKERVRSPKKKVRKSFSNVDEEATEDEDLDETPQPKKKGKSRKKIIESDDEPEEESPPLKKRGKGKRKAVETESEGEDDEEMPKKRGSKKKPEVKKGKKGGLANLLSKRGAAKKAEKQMRGLDDTYEDDEDDNEEDNGRRGRKGKKNQEENKENARSKSGKRGRNLDDSLDLNVDVLEVLVKGLIKHRDGWPFDRPITKADAPDYHLCVRVPMDFDTIRVRLDDLFYTSNQAVINDIRLVFSNCYSYNMEDAEEYGCAERLEKYFDSQLKAQGLIDEEASKPRAKKRRL